MKMLAIILKNLITFFGLWEKFMYWIKNTLFPFKKDYLAFNIDHVHLYHEDTKQELSFDLEIKEYIEYAAYIEKLNFQFRTPDYDVFSFDEIIFGGDYNDKTKELGLLKRNFFIRKSLTTANINSFMKNWGDSNKPSEFNVDIKIYFSYWKRPAKPQIYTGKINIHR